MQTANIPLGAQSMGGWHMVLRRKNGMLLMWVTQAPMERLKEMLVSGRNVVQGAQRFFRSGGERVSLGSIAGAKPKRKSDIGRKANSLSQHKPNKVFSTFHEHSHKPPVPKLPVASAERVRYELNRLGADDGR